MATVGRATAVLVDMTKVFMDHMQIRDPQSGDMTDQNRTDDLLGTVGIDQKSLLMNRRNPNRHGMTTHTANVQPITHTPVAWPKNSVNTAPV